MKRVSIILLLISFSVSGQNTEVISIKAKEYLLPPEIKSEMQSLIFRQEILPYCNLFNTDCFFNVHIINNEGTEVYIVQLSGIPVKNGKYYNCFLINGYSFFFTGFIPSFFLPTNKERIFSYENHFYYFLGRKINIDIENPQWQLKRANNAFSIESEPPAIWPVFPMKGLYDYFKYYNSTENSTTKEIIQWKVIYPYGITTKRYEPLPRCRLLSYSNPLISNNRIVSKFIITDSSLAKNMSYLLSHRIKQQETGSFILSSNKSNQQETLSFLCERTICSQEGNSFLGYFLVDGTIIFIQGGIPPFLSPSNERDFIEVPAIQANPLSCNFFIEPSSCCSDPIMIISSKSLNAEQYLSALVDAGSYSEEQRFNRK